MAGFDVELILSHDKDYCEEICKDEIGVRRKLHRKPSGILIKT